MIKIENVYKSFGSHQILKGPSVAIDKGKVLCIIGPSGSGKTTFLRCVNCLEMADSGRLTIEDFSVDLKSVNDADVLKIRRMTAMVFQSYNLFVNKTAEENIMEGLVMAQGKSREEAREIAVRLLTEVGLADKRAFYPYQLSGGQQQRVGIARAIALKPKVVLFDEPTSALDPESIGGILDIIEGLAKKGQTMMIVTHEMNFARYIADKVIFMDDGVILEEGSAADVFDHPREERTRAFLRRLDYTRKRM